MVMLRGLRPRSCSVGLVAVIGISVGALQPVAAAPPESPTNAWDVAFGSAIMTDYNLSGVRQRGTRFTTKSEETGLVVGGVARAPYGFYLAGSAALAPVTGGSFEQKFKHSILPPIEGSVDGGAFYNGHVELGFSLPEWVGLTAMPFVAYNIQSPQITGTIGDRADSLVDQRWQALQFGAQVQTTFWQNWVVSAGGEYSPVTQVRNDALTAYGTGWGANAGVTYIPPDHPNSFFGLRVGVIDMCASTMFFAMRTELSQKTYFASLSYQVEFGGPPAATARAAVVQNYLGLR